MTVEPRATDPDNPDYDPEQDPNVKMAEASAEVLNEQSEKAAEMDEIWAEARPNETEPE
jgi:hypothetical protein